MTPLLLAVALVQSVPQSPSPSPHSPYWQQEVRYEIRASLDEAAGVLSGTERVVYINRSPDTLTTFAFHLHLNAFRPGSRWADADSAERRRRFNDLKDPDYGYNHVRDVRIMGEAVKPIWPFAPDSTIVRFLLPRPLAPGDSMVLELGWDARPSTTPRRQGRRGRQFDFAQWYPKVVVYDHYGWEEHPLYPGGEFYGEFATYLVELNLPSDQVLGATGVPICGDPGWERANQVPDLPIDYQREYYPRAPRYRAVGMDCVAEAPSAGVGPLAPGRKRVVWYAEQVHHFALSLNPAYRYEGGKWGDVVIHVLYQPGDEPSWGTGIAVTRTAKALAWLDAFYGKFGWPQITNVHRIEGGGTEFPMMIMDGSAGQGLIVHELGHNYTMGMLANNEWREGWLDEGFTSFQSSLFAEAQRPGLDTYSGSEAWLTLLDLEGESEPASLISEDYRDFNSYNVSIYSRGERFFHLLRYVVGDEALHNIMRTYYARWQFRHVDEEAFKEVAEEVSGLDLGWLFAQELHSTTLVDYGLGRVKIDRAPSGKSWETRVEVIRKEEGRLPVEVWVIGASDTAVARTSGLPEREWVTVETRSRPKQVLLDPRLRTRDWNMLNNTWRRTWLFPSREPRREIYLDTWFSERSARDHRTEGVMPVAWYNDAGGITLGLRSRENYFGRFDENQTIVSVATGWQSDRNVKDTDFFLRLRNPTWLRGPGLSEQLEVYDIEGRYGARLGVDRTTHDHLGWGPTRTRGFSLTWLTPDDFRYLDRGYYENAGTVELEAHGAVTDRRNGWDLGIAVAAAGGLAYNREGLAAATGRTDLDPFYGRFTLTATGRRDLGARWRLGTRFFGGVSTSGNDPVKQRQIYAAGADPLEQFANPFLRSEGALLVRPDVYYHAPGGGDLRGFDPHLSSQAVLALNLELERALLIRGDAKLFRRMALGAFGDAGQMIGDNGSTRFLADLGLGLRAEHQIGETSFTTRADFPLYVNHPALAADTHPGTNRAGFRWSFSFTPAF
ncbi:MAG TPA: M1 family metallopeptidase [Gemmatimonadales bacterium]|nr:M1 family metallopeptidase [Gemmatimonadales bacterium]